MEGMVSMDMDFGGGLLMRVMDKLRRKGKWKDQQNLFMATMATMTTITITIIPTMDIAMVGELVMYAMQGFDSTHPNLSFQE